MIEYLKNELVKTFNQVRIIKEDRQDREWRLEFEIQNRSISFLGGGSIQVEIISEGKKFYLIQLDRSLLGKQSTTKDNLKSHVSSLKEILEKDEIRYKPDSMEQVCQDLDLQYTMEWGIINSDGSRVQEFITYIRQHKMYPFSIHFQFLELIIASMNDSMVDKTCSDELKDSFYNYIEPILGDQKYYPIITYWIGISSKDEFPVGYLLIEYFKKDKIDTTI